MKSKLTTYLALWRKDLRANALTVALVLAVGVIVAFLSLKEQWRYGVAACHVLLVPISSAFLLGTALFATESSCETEVYFDSLPVPRRLGWAARSLLVVLLLIVVTAISTLVGEYLIATAPFLAERGALAPRELPELPLAVRLSVAMAGACALGVAALAATFAACASLRAARCLAVVMAAALVFGAACVNALFGACVASKITPSLVWDWVFPSAVFGVAFGGAWAARGVTLTTPPLEKGKRLRAILARWVAVLVCFLALSAALNGITTRIGYDDTVQIRQATATEDHIVVNVYARRAGRECTDRLWSIDASTGEMRLLGRGTSPHLHDPEFLLYSPPRLLGECPPTARRLLDLESGERRGVPVPQGLRKALRAGGRPDLIDLHPRSGVCVMRGEARSGFLARSSYWSAANELLCYSSNAQPTPLSSPDNTPFSQFVEWNSDGTAAIVTLAPESRFDVPRLGGAVEAAVAAGQLWWAELPRGERRLLSGPSKALSVFPNCLSPDDRWVCFFVPAADEDSGRWDLVVTRTDKPHLRVVDADLPPLRFAPRWSPDSDRLATMLFDGDLGSGYVHLWERKSDMVRRFHANLVSKPMRAGVWRPKDRGLDGRAEYLTPGASFDVTRLSWSADGRRFAFIVQEGGCVSPGLLARGQYRRRVRISAWCLNVESEGTLQPVLLTDETYDHWATPHGGNPAVRALAWTQGNRLACLMQDGTLLEVDPDALKVRVAIKPGGGAQ